MSRKRKHLFDLSDSLVYIWKFRFSLDEIEQGPTVTFSRIVSINSILVVLRITLQRNLTVRNN